MYDGWSFYTDLVRTNLLVNGPPHADTLPLVSTLIYVPFAIMVLGFYPKRNDLKKKAEERGDKEAEQR